MPPLTTASPAEVLEAALKLKPEERERVARELWHSVQPPGAPSKEDPGFVEELERRAQAMRDDPSQSVPWEVARRRIQERLERQRADRAD